MYQICRAVNGAPLATLFRRLLERQPPRAASLVVSIFGDAVVPHGGAVWLGTLIRWLAPFGVNERSVRTAVRRLTADDWFRTHSVGRRSDYLLTVASRHRFADAERRIYATRPPPWDGRWCIVVLGRGVLEARRRDAARRELRWRGFGEIAPGVLVHPSADLAQLGLALRDLGLDRRAIVLRAGREERGLGEGAPLRDLVASAWDLRDLAGEYRRYLRRFEPVAERLGTLPAPEECFRLRVLALHDYRRILLRDPELPAELLPEGWVGSQARGMCAEIYRRVEEPAVRYVLESGSTAAGPLPPPGDLYFRRFGGLRRTLDRRSAAGG